MSSSTSFVRGYKTLFLKKAFLSSTPQNVKLLNEEELSKKNNNGGSIYYCNFYVEFTNSMHFSVMILQIRNLL